MELTVKIGIVICDRYRRCAGGKCFRAMKNREGAFSVYRDMKIELVGFSTCDGCPGGNIEYTADEMVKNGVDVIHFATGMLVGYPPCRNISTFKEYLESRYQVKVVVGTHPIPKKYLEQHTKLGSWKGDMWKSHLAATLATEEIQAAYD